MIEIPETNDVNILKDFLYQLYRAQYEVVTRIEELEPFWPKPPNPPDLNVHVSDGISVKMVNMAGK